MSTYCCERQGLYCITVSHCVVAIQYQSSRVCYTDDLAGCKLPAKKQDVLQKFGICCCQPVASCGLLLLNTLFCRCAKPYMCAALCCMLFVSHIISSVSPAVFAGVPSQCGQSSSKHLSFIWTKLDPCYSFAGFDLCIIQFCTKFYIEYFFCFA